MVELLISIVVVLIAIMFIFRFKHTPKRNTFSDYFIKHPADALDNGSIMMVIGLKDHSRLSDIYKTDYNILHKTLTSFSKKVFEIVRYNDGRIFKNHDNSILVSWSNKFGLYDQNSKAIHTAFELSEMLIESNKLLSKEGVYPLRLGISVSHDIQLSNKLEDIGKIYGVTTTFDETVSLVIDNSLIIFELDTISVDSNVINIFTVIDRMSVSNMKDSTININQHKRFLIAYRDRRFEMAATIASSLRSAWNGKLLNYYSTMISRCKTLRDHPPTYKWNEVYWQ